MVLGEVVVGLEALEPDAAFEGVLAEGVEGVVVEGEEVAGDGVVGAGVGSGGGDGGGSVGGSGAGDDDGVGGDAGADRGREGLLGRRDVAGEVEAGAGEAEAGDVDEVGREDVVLFGAEDLLAEVFFDVGVGVGGGRDGVGVVDGVDGVEGVVGGEVGVEAGGAEVFADVLGSGADVLGDTGVDAVLGDLGAVGDGPEVEQRLDAGDGGGAGGGVGDEGDEGLAEVLAVAFVVGEEEELVLAEGATEGGAEVVALELGDAGAVEVVAGVEVAVAEELVDGAVEGVGAAGGDDGDLRAVALAVGGGVGVGDDVELADAVDAEELAGGAAGGVVDERGSGVLDAVEEEEIVLRAAAGDGEHAADRGVGGAGAAAALVGVVDGAGVEQDELVVGAAVEGELLDLAGVDQAGGLFGGGVDDGLGVVDVDGLAAGDGESEVEIEGLADGEGEGAGGGGEAGGVGGEGVGADGMEEAMYWPEALVVRERWAPVSSLWTRTWALGMAAPVASVTRPERVAPTTWARTGSVRARRRNGMRRRRGMGLLKGGVGACACLRAGLWVLGVWGWGRAGISGDNDSGTAGWKGMSGGGDAGSVGVLRLRSSQRRELLRSG